MNSIKRGLHDFEHEGLFLGLSLVCEYDGFNDDEVKDLDRIMDKMVEDFKSKIREEPIGGDKEFDG